MPKKIVYEELRGRQQGRHGLTSEILADKAGRSVHRHDAVQPRRRAARTHNCTARPPRRSSSIRTASRPRRGFSEVIRARARHPGSIPKANHTTDWQEQIQ